MSGSVAVQVSTNSQTAVFQPTAAGQYTHCVKDMANGCERCFYFYVMFPEGLPGENSSFGSDNNDVIIYPNPANNILNIQITDGSLADESCQFQITDCLGRKVKEEELAAIYQYDLNLMTLAEEVASAIDNVEAALGTDGLKTAIRNLTKVAQDCVDAFEKRADVIKEMSTQSDQQ